ncbi:MAG: protein kinase family protein [Gemmatimonadetes bacterium]|nr:protein kinase family protein [Gemmatimonadota bacterium]
MPSSECTDDWSNFAVAKVLVPAGQAYDDVRAQWIRELDNLQSLRHPYVTFIHDAFEYRDTFYLIMERCHEQLSELISWPDLRPEVWLHPIAQCVLATLVHSQDGIRPYKDLHPGNVFVARNQGVMSTPNPATVFKVGDLGISRLAPDIDVFNTILAKWMLPPEALAPARFGVIGPQLDIYHAGLTFLSLMLRQIPTFSEQEILDGRPRQLAESLPSPYGPVLSRALRRHVDQRTQSALDFWREIAAVRYTGGLLSG